MAQSSSVVIVFFGRRSRVLMLWRRFLDFLIYLAVRIAICLIQAVPIETCARGTRYLAFVCNDVLRIRRPVVEENLALAFPGLSVGQRRRLARRMWEHLLLLVAEVAHAPRKIHETNWRDYILLRDIGPLVELLLDERPTVIVSSHYGNFELSGFMLGVLGFPSHTIARPLDNPFLNHFVNQFRGFHGQHIIPKNGSARLVDALLARGGTLAFLADQHAGPRGCWVDFFGRPASTHKAIALFALANDAPLAVCYDRRQGRPLRHVVGLAGFVDPRTLDAQQADVRHLTQWYTRQFEPIIRQAPEQYWWLHRRWREGPEEKPSRRQAA